MYALARPFWPGRVGARPGRRWLVGPLLGVLLVLAGCGASGSAGAGGGTAASGAATTAASTSSAATSATATTASATTTASASAAAAASTGGSALLVRDDPKLGKFFTDSNGKTLYWYTKDAPGVSNCSGGCLAAWPPLLAATPPTLPSGTPGTVSLITRSDGGKQVAYNDLPLYYYAKDTSPTDTSGQGVGKAWYVMPPGTGPAVTPTPSS